MNPPTDAASSPLAGVALSAAVIALPALFVVHGGVALVLLTVVAGAVVLEARRPSRVSGSSVRHLSGVPRPSLRPARGPRPGWSVVERDGQRSLVMTWKE